MRRPLCLLAFCLAVHAQAATKPRPAHGRFSTNNYTLTFRAPPGLTYCPVPANWTGSDHGTILFLIPPRRCTGVGYPASDRGAEPAGLPHIEVYYGHRDLADAPLPPCRAVGSISLLGQPRPLCAGHAKGLILRTVSALYSNDTTNEVSLTLVTTRQRLTKDIALFSHLVRSVGMCTSDMALPGGKRFGSGPPCGRGDFY